MWWENISGKLLLSNCGSHVMCLLYIMGPLKVAWLEFSETHVHHSVTSISKRRNKQYLVVLVSPLTIWGLCNVMLEILSFSFFVSICCCCLWFFSIILIMLFFNSSWKTKLVEFCWDGWKEGVYVTEILPPMGFDLLYSFFNYWCFPWICNLLYFDILIGRKKKPKCKYFHQF